MFLISDLPSHTIFIYSHHSFSSFRHIFCSIYLFAIIIFSSSSCFFSSILLLSYLFFIVLYAFFLSMRVVLSSDSLRRSVFDVSPEPNKHCNPRVS